MAGNKALTNEGPDFTEVKIIGVELAVRDHQAGQETELEMFACSHTMPANRYRDKQVRITLHTSRGDFTMLGCPPW